MALNPRMTLYRDRSLRPVLLASRSLRAFLLYRERLGSLPWAVYRVCRIYPAKGRAGRSVEKPALGTQDEALDALQGEALRHGREIETTGHSPRFHIAAASRASTRAPRRCTSPPLPWPRTRPGRGSRGTGAGCRSRWRRPERQRPEGRAGWPPLPCEWHGLCKRGSPDVRKASGCGCHGVTSASGWGLP